MNFIQRIDLLYGRIIILGRRRRLGRVVAIFRRAFGNGARIVGRTGRHGLKNEKNAQYNGASSYGRQASILVGVRIGGLHSNSGTVLSKHFASQPRTRNDIKHAVPEQVLYLENSPQKEYRMIFGQLKCDAIKISCPSVFLSKYDGSEHAG